MKRNFSDNELIAIYVDHCRKAQEQKIENQKLKREQKLQKVPALYLLETDKVPHSKQYGNEFSDLVERYGLLNKTGNKNYGYLTNQVKMLLHLYRHQCINPSELFVATGISSVTGNRYVAKFKKFGFLESTGSQNCYYTITEIGINFLENKVS
ncbi:MAG: hypothetical protein ABIS37_00945, partial [Bacteroidia bacterium]